MTFRSVRTVPSVRLCSTGNRNYSQPLLEEAHDKLVLASRGHTTGAAAGACKNLHSRPRGRLGACRGHRAPPTPLWRAAGPRRASHVTKCPTVPNLYTSVYSKTPTGIRDRRGQRYTVLRQNTEYTYSVFCITASCHCSLFTEKTVAVFSVHFTQYVNCQS